MTATISSGDSAHSPSFSVDVHYFVYNIGLAVCILISLVYIGGLYITVFLSIFMYDQFSFP